jgi:hypothetical protein
MLSEVSHWTGFEDEFSNIESMLMDSTGWTGLMDDWSDNPVYIPCIPPSSFIFVILTDDLFLPIQAYARFTYNGFA